ncbi:ECF transporter S component [Metabacillus sp. 84]|uniref:ECF transporter S component n=1 Tax=unclassified Metabacillus TaxID=2675274 RepID=UPI003CF0BE46
MSKLQKMTSISIMASCSLVLYYFKFPLPIFPAFLTLDLSDIPALISAITLGPAAGILVQFIKNILEYVLHGSYVGFPVGQTANFLSGSLMVGLIGFFYHAKKTITWKSITLSIVLFLTAMYALNYFFILPAIMNLLGLSAEQYTASFTPFNPLVQNMETAVLFIIVPFNLVKITLVYSIGIPFAVKLQGILHKRRLVL